MKVANINERHRIGMVSTKHMKKVEVGEEKVKGEVKEKENEKDEGGSWGRCRREE